MVEKTRKAILDILRKHPEGLTVAKISSLLKISRITATKYIERLIGEGMIYEKKIGVYRLLFLRERFLESIKEEKIIRKLKKKLR